MSETGESTERLNEFHNRTQPDIAELITGDRYAQPCAMPGGQEHDHEKCRDINIERVIETALAHAPEIERIAARHAIDDLIREARLNGMTVGIFDARDVRDELHGAEYEASAHDPRDDQE